MRFTAIFDRRSLFALGSAAAVLIILVVIAHRTIGWTAVADRARTVPLDAWLGFLVLMSASYLARVFRFWALVRPLGPTVTVGAAAPVFLVHNTIVTFVPARLGEIAMPALAHRWAGVHWSGVVGLLAWWRVVDLAIVCMLALALVGLGVSAFKPLLWIALAACTLPLFVFALRARIVPLLQRWADRSPMGKIPKLVRRIAEGLPRTWHVAVIDFVLACVSWASKFAAVAIVLGAALDGRSPFVWSVSTTAPWHGTIAATIAADVAGSLPVPSFAGTGPYEAAAVAVLVAYGVPSTQALAAGLVAHGALLAGVLVSGIMGLVLQGSRIVRARAHITQP